MNYYPVDLQVHSTCSDGTLTPTQLVELAHSRNVSVLSITDHDSVLGVDEALEAGERWGVEIVPAVEFSTRREPERDLAEINILGYWIDHKHPDLTSTLDKVIQGRIDQKIRQIERLHEFGLICPVDEVLELAGGVPGRPHIAEVLMRHNPGRFQSRQQVFDELLRTGGPAQVDRAFSLTVEDAIELVHQAGGIAVLAHPGVYDKVRDVDGLIRRLAEESLDGLEIWYSYDKNRPHYGISAEEAQAIIDHFDCLADELNLLKTGGSDYHGARKADLELGERGMTLAAYTTLKQQAQPLLQSRL